MTYGFRAAIAAFIVAACFTAAPSLAAEKEIAFPYTAWVTGEQVRVRSGPGADAYATDELALGAEVEVYRHDPGGWCAIRPPQGSFSWITGRYLRMTEEDGIAEITANGVTAWVGSRLQRVNEFQWQVKLEQGELVEILDSKKLINAEGSTAETWYKIAPPDGEFRWITYRARTPSAPCGNSATEPAATRRGPTPPPGLGDARINREATTAESLNSETAVAQNSGRWQQREPEAERPRFDPAAALASLEREPVQSRAAGEPAFIENVGDARPIAIRSTPVTPAAGSVLPVVHETAGVDVEDLTPQTASLDSAAAVDAELAQLELDLAEMVVSPPHQWQLEPLKQRAQGVIEANQSALSRGRARVILENLAQFEASQQQHLAANRIDLPAAVPATASPAISGLQPMRASVAQASFHAELESPTQLLPTGGESPAPQPIYDATGILKQAYSKHPDAPQYVLTDEANNILMLVKEAPGRNLHRHLNKRVGLFGREGFLAKFSKPYLMAERVVELDSVSAPVGSW